MSSAQDPPIVVLLPASAPAVESCPVPLQGLPTVGSLAEAPVSAWVADLGEPLALLGPATAGQRRPRIVLEVGSGPWGQRLRRGPGRRDPLARALGLHRRPARTATLVLDATAGFCRESLLLAALGCRVVACERSPLLASLAGLALGRLCQDPRLGVLAERIDLRAQDARELLGRMPAEFVYLDPMFPERRKDALVRLPMRMLSELLGADRDAFLLLRAALDSGARRVVVKRPAGVPPLTGPEPDMVVPGGRMTRFDVYLSGPAQA